MTMATKRPAIDLMALTSEQAQPMPEAVQRMAPQPQPARPVPAPVVARPQRKPAAAEHVPTANLQALAFKVSPAFRKRFRERAASADLKLNELLFAAFEAWEEKQGLRKPNY
jgi:hypothetical protein